MGIGNFLSRFAARVLDVDDTVVPKEQIDTLRDFLSRHQFDLSSRKIEKLLNTLKQKHLVDSITVIKQDGDLVISSEGNGVGDAATGAHLLKQISTQVEKPESIMIKLGNQWLMLLPFEDKIYMIKASASLSNIELKALAKEVEHFLNKRSQN